jgi:hypothetical protein
MAGITKYDEAIANKICEELANSSKGLNRICEGSGMPCPATVYNWLDENPTFLEKYARARRLQGDYGVDEIVEIADTEEDPNKARVRIDARKWLASKLNPKKYGDRLDIDHTSAGEKILPTVILQTSPALEQQYGFKPEADDSLPTTDGG